MGERMSVLLPPKIPYLSTPVPQRTDPENFRSRMDLFLIELPEVVSAINVVVDYIDQAKMDVSSMEEVRDAAHAARDETQQIKTETQQIKEAAEESLALIAIEKLDELDLLADQKIIIMDLIREAAEASATSAAASAEAAGKAAGFPEYLAGTEGKPLTRMRDGSGVHFSEEFTPVILTSANRTLVAGDRLAVNTSTRTVTITLPAEPFVGATVFLVDYAGTWDINNVTVNRNGRMIMGLNENMQLDLRHASISLVFTDLKGWILL